MDACRRILRRGATPAVLRLYDEAESQRSHGTDGSVAVLLVLDEAERALVDATMAVVDEECADATRLDAALVDGWLHHRNDVCALEALTRKGFVVDTMEIAGPWSRLPAIYRDATAALLAVPHALGGHGPPVPQLHRRGLPVLHVRGDPAPGRSRGHLRRAVERRDDAPS